MYVYTHRRQLITYVRMYVHLFSFVFVLLFYVGTHLARGYSSGDPRNHYRYTHTHTHTHSYTQHNYKQSQTIKSYYTHTLCGQWQHFFQVIQGCRAGFEPKTSHNSCSASSLKLPLSHPCTPWLTDCICNTRPQ